MTRRRTSLLLLGTLGAGLLAGRLSHEREQVSAADAGVRGIALVPMYAEGATRVGADLEVGPYGDEKDGHHDDAVNVRPEMQHLIGVRVNPVERRSVTERLRLPGRVMADDTRVYRINLGFSGIIRELSTATTGSRVRRHDWLATISAPDVRSLIQAHIIALDAVDRASKDVEAPTPIRLATASLQQSVDRLLSLGLSSVQMDEIARSRQIPATLKITAPEAGVVLARNVSIGQTIMRGEELLRIADLRRVWILADVFGRDAEYIRPGMTAEVSLPDRPRRFGATVSRDVPPQLDSANPSVQVRLEVDNPDLLLRPGMVVDVELPIELPPALAVPVEAVIDSGLTSTVFVERSPGVFEPRAVETGWRFGDRVEILKGLENGERIAVSGTFLLDSETRMRHVTPQSPRGHDRPHH